MASPACAAPPTRLRRFRYSLRTLLLLFLVVSVGLAWFAARLHRAQRQRAAVSAIVSLSGVVGYDDEPADITAAPTRSSVPVWLRRLLGDDFFHTAVSLVAFNDGTMEAAQNLTDLRRIDFVGGPASDAGLRYVRGLSRLQILNLSDTQITDAGLEHLHDLTHLRELRLRGTRATPEAIRRLQHALPQCRIER